jgi:hypothetical protein
MSSTSPFPKLSAALGILNLLTLAMAVTAISVQWHERSELQSRLEAMEKERASATHALAEEVAKKAKRDQTYAKALNTWIDDLNTLFSQLGEASNAARRDFIKATNARAAQSIVSVYAAASAAGVDWKGETRDEVISDVLAGRAPKSGPFEGTQFRVPTSSVPDLAGAKAFIGIESDGRLFYDETGRQPTEKGSGSENTNRVEAPKPASTAGIKFPKIPLPE